MSAPYPPPPAVDPLVRRVAARICYRRHWPFDLEPGDAYGVDAILPNGDPAHELWRQYVDDAEKIVAMVRNAA